MSILLNVCTWWPASLLERCRKHSAMLTFALVWISATKSWNWSLFVAQFLHVSCWIGPVGKTCKVAVRRIQSSDRFCLNGSLKHQIYPPGGWSWCKMHSVQLTAEHFCVSLSLIIPAGWMRTSWTSQVTELYAESLKRSLNQIHSYLETLEYVLSRTDICPRTKQWRDFECSALLTKLHVSR